MTTQNKTIDDLRATLFAALEGVKNGSLDLEKARAINDIGKSIIDTARVEVDYLKATGGGESAFIASAVGNDNLPPGITGVRRHRIK